MCGDTTMESDSENRSMLGSSDDNDDIERIQLEITNTQLSNERIKLIMTIIMVVALLIEIYMGIRDRKRIEDSVDNLATLLRKD